MKRLTSSWAHSLAILVAYYSGCILCYLLQSRTGLNPVLSSSLLGFGISFIPIPKTINKNSFYLAFFAGTFAGMSSLEILSSHSHIVAISILGSILFLISQPWLSGIGGKMGAVAFLSVFLWLLLGVFP